MLRQVFPLIFFSQLILHMFFRSGTGKEMWTEILCLGFIAWIQKNDKDPSVGSPLPFQNVCSSHLVTVVSLAEFRCF